MRQIDPDEPPDAPVETPALRALRRLVTTLTAVMIAGVTAIVILLALRLATPPPQPPLPALPETIALPGGVRPAAVTFGEGWVAVVTDAGAILLYDSGDGRLLQQVAAPD